MFYDLGLQGDEAEAFLQRDRVAMAVRLGHDCVATAHQAADRLSEKDKYATELPIFRPATLQHHMQRWMRTCWNVHLAGVPSNTLMQQLWLLQPLAFQRGSEPISH